MSHKLKLCSGAEAVVKFQKSGWQIIRQRGSHTMLVKGGIFVHIVCAHA